MAYAATINVRSSLTVQAEFALVDDNICLATGTPLTILCNRDYRIVDFLFTNTVVSAEADGSIALDSCLAANSPTGADTTNIGTVDASAGVSLTTFKRAVDNTLTPGANNGLLSTASVTRGRFFRVRSLAGGGDFGANIRGRGLVTILPGNRYAAGAGTYYPNNGLV